MAHQLETFEDGTTAFVSARKDAWHRLGTVLDHTFTAEEGFEVAKLANWNVRTQPLFTELDDGITEVPQRFCTVRDNPVSGKREVIGGNVGNRYVPIQNEESANLLNAVMAESGAKLETAGSIKGGTQTFMTMKLPETMNVGGQDAIDLYIAALNSHDGSTAFRFIVSPVRVVCANTQEAALKNAKSRFSIRHTLNGSAAVSEAHRALELAYKYTGEFEVEAEKLLAQSFTDKQMENFTAKLFDVKGAKSETVETRRKDAQQSVMTLFRDSSTVQSIKNTKYGAYQSVVEYIDHYQAVPSTKDGEDLRAFRQIAGQVMAIQPKLEAFKVLSASR